MDLLVQVTTAHCLSPGDYSLQAMGDKGVLPFKPNTPIGALDTFTVKIVEKKSNIRGRAPQVRKNWSKQFDSPKCVFSVSCLRAIFFFFSRLSFSGTSIVSKFISFTSSSPQESVVRSQSNARRRTLRDHDSHLHGEKFKSGKIRIQASG